MIWPKFVRNIGQSDPIAMELELQGIAGETENGSTFGRTKGRASPRHNTKEKMKRVFMTFLPYVLYTSCMENITATHFKITHP